MLLYIREERLLISLYLFVCRFVSVAPISRISLKAYIGGFLENLLGNPIFVKIVLKLLRCLLDDQSMLQYIRQYYMVINALPLKEAESSCLCSRRLINITRSRHSVTYNVLCCLVLNWAVVEPVTSVYSIYQHSSSLDWSVFLSPDRMTLDGMTHRRIYTIGFCTHYHRIDVANLTKCFS